MAVSGMGGYVLAGGKSSRMGRDKAQLELAGKPLVQHAVAKLRRFCSDVHVLSGSAELERFAPLVRDLHEGCGPMGGMEAMFAHSPHEWNLLLPVDVPFLPAAFLEEWVRSVTGACSTARVALFAVGGKPQPLLCLLHREVGPFVREAMERGFYKVYPVLENAGRVLAGRQNVTVESTFLNTVWEDAGAERNQRALWFANLNTPEEFVEAERHASALASEDLS